MANDKKLWKVFSEYIRLRDADNSGMCRCFTCGRLAHWRDFDCGHGIPRQHKATKFDTKNNHAQCKRCNGFEGGRMDVYKERVNQKYGPGTWETLEVLSRSVCRRGQFEIDAMEEFYKKEVATLKKLKRL